MHATNGSDTQLAARPRRVVALGHPALAGLGPWLAQAGLPFVLIVYLGLRGGGYDALVRSEIGIAAWWIVLLGAAAGALPIARLNRAAWVGLGLLLAFAAWTTLGISWSESAERSAAEAGRVATLLGVFALALIVQGRDGLRRMVGGVAAGIAVVGAIALLSRLDASGFADSAAASFLPEAEARAHDPLNYWNGLAAFTAIGIPLLLALATYARHTLARALALAAIPMLGLTLYFTLSRGGAGELAIALGILFCLHPRRLTLAGYAAVATAGSAILIAAASQRDALADGLSTPAAVSQGDEMVAMTIVVCAGVALLASALALAQRHDVGPRIQISRRTTARAAGLAAIAALGIALAAGAPGKLSDAWDDFESPGIAGAGAERFDTTSGSGRYQFWETALDANATQPLVGIGPGTYEFFWAREGSLPVFARDAHSLYMETLAELGIVGLLLIAAVVAAPFVAGTRRLLALGEPQRILVSGALAGCAAFATAAAIDWAWELTILPVIFLLLAAAVIARPRPADSSFPRSRAIRIALPVLAVVGMVAVALPMAGIDAIRDSQAAVRAGDLPKALSEANTAADLAPYAAGPHVQQALVLELQGDVGGAVAAAREATEAEPTNWRTWLVLSRLEAKAGNADASVAAYREARGLNPRSPLFQE